jgi:hypothetical protein
MPELFCFYSGMDRAYKETSSELYLQPPRKRRLKMRKSILTATLAFMLCLTGLVISGEAQTEMFVDNGNGTVTDTRMGLMWTKDANLFGKLH